jgi:hypothetical protein
MSLAIDRMLVATTEDEKSRANMWALAWARVAISSRKSLNRAYREMRMAIGKAAGRRWL